MSAADSRGIEVAGLGDRQHPHAIDSEHRRLALELGDRRLLRGGRARHPLVNEPAADARRREQRTRGADVLTLFGETDALIHPGSAAQLACDIGGGEFACCAETTKELDRVLTVALVVIGRENCSASSSTRR